MKLRAITASLIIAVVAAAPCYAEDSEAQRAETMRGSVTSVDWVGAAMSVDNTAFSVPPGTDIYKGSGRVGFSDINVGDQAIVTFKRDPSGMPEAISITIEYRGDFPT